MHTTSLKVGLRIHEFTVEMNDLDVMLPTCSYPGGDPHVKLKGQGCSTSRKEAFMGLLHDPVT